MDPVDPWVFTVLEDFTRLLDEPSREVPGVCVLHLLGLLNHAIPVCAKLHTEDVERKLSRFRTSTYRWICAPRSPALWARVFSWACTGPTCTTRTTPAHEFAVKMLAELGINSPSCLFLMYLFAGIKVPFSAERESKMRLDRITRRPAWPTEVEQMLPYGDTTMLGLLKWLEADWTATASDSLVANIHILAEITRPMSLHNLLDSPVFIPKGILPLLQAAFDLLSGRHRHDLPNSAQPKEQQATLRLNTALAVMIDITLWQFGPRQRRTFTGPWAAPLLAAYSRAHALCKTLCSRYGRNHPQYKQFDSYVHGFLELGCVILQDFPELRASLPRAQTQVFPVIVPTSWELMLRLLARLELAQQCAAPDCVRTYVEPLTFRYCSACKRVAYCSRQCQRRAWAHPAVPHRSICQALRTVCATAELPRKGARVLFERGKVGPQDVPDELVRSIIEHFDAQDQYEAEQRYVCFRRRHQGPVAKSDILSEGWGKCTEGRHNVPRPSAG
jgi:hypothetical protein